MATRIPKRWFKRVAQDMGEIVPALEYYSKAWEEGNAELEIAGNLSKQNRDHVGLVAFYDAMHSDLDAILGIVERNLRIQRGLVLREYVDNGVTNAKINATELKTIMESDQRIIDASMLVDEVKYVYKQFSSLMKAAEARGFALNRITNLRIAGLEEVEV